MSTGWLGLDWGNVPAWTSTASILIAAMAYRRSVKDKKQEQAAKIFSWVRPLGENGTEGREVRVANRSDAPVYSMLVKPFKSDEIHIEELLAEDVKTFDISPLNSEKITRGFVAGIGISSAFTLVFAASRLTLEPLPEITFRDSAGRWWRRDAVGNIRKTSPKEPMSTSLGVYVFGYNIGRVIYKAETNEWKIGRKKGRVNLPPVKTLARVIAGGLARLTRKRKTVDGSPRDVSDTPMQAKSEDEIATQKMQDD
jgi:hypothetical protein